MSNLVTRQSLSTYLSELDAACDWLYSLGVQPHQTRFAKYKNDLSEVLRNRIADTLHELPKIVSVQQFLDAFIESGELIDIWKAFAGHSNGCVLRKIRAAVKGHPDPAHRGASPRRPAATRNRAREKSAGAAGCRERRTRGDAARRESEPTQEEVERTVSFDCYRSPCF